MRDGLILVQIVSVNIWQVTFDYVCTHMCCSLGCSLLGISFLPE